MPIQPNEIIAFTDFDLNFLPHPLSGDLPLKVNLDDIKQALLTLFYLDKYDVPFDMDAYSNVRKYLFDHLNAITASNLQTRIEWLIKKYETRVQVHSISVKPNANEDGYDIYVVYRVKDLNLEDSIKYTFQRVR